MDAAQYGNKTREELIAEIDSLQVQVASLTSRLAEADAGPQHSTGRSDATRLRAVLEQSQDVAYRRDLRLDRYEYMSPVCQQVLGYSADEIAGMPLEQVLSRVHPDDREDLDGAVAKAMDSGSGRLQYRWLHKNGQWRHLADFLTLVKDADGRPLYLNGVARDVTEYKQAQAALQESEECFRSLVEFAPEAIFVQSQGRFVYLNPAMLRLLGAGSPGDLIGTDCMKSVPPEFHEAIHERIRFQQETGQPAPLVELEYLRLDGSRVPVESTAVAIRYQGRDAHLVFLRDITERKRAADALRASEERFRWLFEKAPLAAGISRNSRIILVNQRYIDLYGFQSADELVGQSVVGQWAPESQETARKYSRRRSRGEPAPSEFEGTAQRKDGTRFPVHVVVEDVELPDGRAAMGFFTDITERKRAEQTLADEKRFVEALFASLPGTAFVFDARGRRIRWNAYCTETLGWSDDDMRRLGVCDIIAARDRQRCAKAFQEAYVNGHAEVELTALAKDGREWPFLLNSVRTTFAGEPYVVTVGIDISDRKRIEEQLKQLNATLEQRVSERTADLRRSEEEYRSLFEGVPVGVCRTTLDGRLLQANPAVLEMLGYADFDSLPRNVLEVYLNPEDRQRLRQLLETREIVRDFEVQMRRSDGSAIWVQSTARLGRDAAGRVLYIEASLRDITERKRAEESLAEAHRSLKATLEAIPDMMFEVDGQGRIHDYHASHTDMLYVAPEAFLGRLVQEVLPADAANVILASLAQAQAEGRSRGASYALAMPAGRRWFELSVVAKSGGAGPHSRYLALVRDITEHRRAEEEVLREKALSEAIISGLPGAFYMFDRQGRIVRWNEEYLRATEATAEEVADFRLLGRVADEDKERAAAAVERVFAQGQANIEAEIVSKSGKRTPYHLAARRLEIGKQVYLVGTGYDVSERKRAEEALQQRNRYIETVFEQSPIGFAASALDTGSRVFVTSRFEDIYGVPRGSITSHRDFFERVWPNHPAFREQLRDRVNADITSGDPNRLHWENVPVWLASGEIRYISASSILLPDQNLMVSTVQDVTERVRAGEAVRASEAKYRALIEDINDIAYSVDAEGRLTYVSPQVARYGWTPEEMLGHSFLEFASPQDRERMFMEFGQTMMGTEFASEFRMQDKVGRAHWFEDHGRAMRDQTGRIVGMRGVLRDVTDRKEAQEAAELYAQRVRQLAVKLSLAEEQERRRLAAILHDDLVQILVAMRMKFAVLRLVKDEPVRLKETEELESLVTRSTQVARSLMSQLSHRALYDMGFVPAAQWLAEDIQRLYGMKVRLADDGQPKPLTELLRVLLYQCLREVLVNAAKHAKVAETRVWIRRHGPVVRVLIEDSGVGFDPSAVSPKPDGSGFGLFSIEERLEPLGGKVEIRSAHGQGTSVLLEVPVEDASDDAGQGRVDRGPSQGVRQPD